MASNLQKRFAKIEQILTAIAGPQRWADCNCCERISAYRDKPEEFEAEMNKRCPRHGLRRLGIIWVSGTDKGPCGDRWDQLYRIYVKRMSGRSLSLLRLREIGGKLGYGAPKF